MRIGIITAGSRGDAQPYVALGQGLARAGHAVTVATHETFRELVLAAGLKFMPVAGDPRAVLGSADRWLATGRTRHVLPAAREFARGLRPLLARMLDDYWRVSQDADLIIYSAVAAPAASVAERLDVPAIAAFLQPLHRTRAFPAIGVPAAVRLGAAFNERSHTVAQLLAWQSVRRQINGWRRDVLALPPISRAGPFARLGTGRRPTPTVYGFSPLVVPKPADWGPQVHVTGYWVAEPSSEWRPPQGLAEFLAAGPPPVYIGFGSMTPRRAERLTALAVEALERSGQRGVLVGGWGELGVGHLPETITVARDVPHEWLFPRMRAVVHHGGAGTTGAALRAGVPSVVVPLSFDQPYWASRVAALEVGPPPIPRRRLSAERLARSIRQAVTDQGLQARAARLGAALRAERGVDRAVAVVEAVAAEWGRAAGSARARGIA